MKLNLLIDDKEPLTRGPGRRARNLLVGLDRLGVPYEICSDNYELVVGMQCNKVFPRWEALPEKTPIGPNVMHQAGDHTHIAKKFKNFVVQSDWVSDFWRWSDPTATMGYTFYIYPASVDMLDGFEAAYKARNQSVNCLFYSKYQSAENRELAQQIYRSRNHSAVNIEYGEYDLDKLRDACSKAEYCIYNSCCEKSANALMEIMSCGVPVYVIDSKRWIGDDKFDRCTSAPHFDERLTGKIGDFLGAGFDDFYKNVKSGAYDPHGFVVENYTAEKVAAKLVEIAHICHA